MHQRLRCQQIAQTHSGQAELGERAQQQHMAVGLRIAADLVQPGAAGKGLVGLVHHHQPAVSPDLGNQAANDRVIPQIRGRVVGISQINQCRLFPGNRIGHGSLIDFKVGGEWHAGIAQTLQLRADGVHHKARLRCEHARARLGADQRQKRNQLIGAVAQHQGVSRRHIHIRSQRIFQGRNAIRRVAVDGQAAQPFSERRLQIRRQGKRVLHGVELEHVERRLHLVGVHGLDLCADTTQGAGWGTHVVGFGQGSRRISAARAWACKPSP